MFGLEFFSGIPHWLDHAFIIHSFEFETQYPRVDEQAIGDSILSRIFMVWAWALNLNLILFCEGEANCYSFWIVLSTFWLNR